MLLDKEKLLLELMKSSILDDKEFIEYKNYFDKFFLLLSKNKENSNADETQFELDSLFYSYINSKCSDVKLEIIRRIINIIKSYVDNWSKKYN